MKILLTAVNAKYIHSNLGIYSLKAYADQVLGLGEAGGRNARAKKRGTGTGAMEPAKRLSSWPSIQSTTSWTRFFRIYSEENRM